MPPNIPDTTTPDAEVVAPHPDTQPEFYRDTDSINEQMLRVDFTRAARLRATATRHPGDQKLVQKLLARATHLEQTWTGGRALDADTWRYLEQAYQDHGIPTQETTQLLDSIETPAEIAFDPALTDTQLRSHRQAAHLVAALNHERRTGAAHLTDSELAAELAALRPPR
ncbi:hypothetical protein [Nocardia asiatica]|uniref:hypothetical protein n=1 Tax=Nocardia asiatica TaxID=209252 RepID=UPI0002DE5EB4|nr:hypothetical protein [Nocardia asiatica]